MYAVATGINLPVTRRARHFTRTDADTGDAGVGLRQRLNDNPPLAAGVAGGCVLIAVVVYFLARPGGMGADKPAGITKEFFSVDDGRTWFPDDAGKLPPFDHQGKPAYRVRVFRCSHGKEFVSHLERYADADLKRMKALIDDEKTRSMEFIQLESGFEAKKPGAKGWVKVGQQVSARTDAIRAPKCPEGSTAGLTRVSPG